MKDTCALRRDAIYPHGGQIYNRDIQSSNDLARVAMSLEGAETIIRLSFYVATISSFSSFV